MRAAAIDIGSTSVLLAVMDDRGRVLADEARTVRLGAGVDPLGRLDPERARGALRALQGYAARAEALGVPCERVRAVATSALRRARDAAAFAACVRERTGLRLEVIGGEEEARLTWLGATWGLEPAAPAAVVDVGGGSTEIVRGQGARMEEAASVEIGAGRLTERFLGPGPVAPPALEAARAAARAALRDLPPSLLGATGGVIAVAGTATTLAALEAGLERWDPAAVHGTHLDRRALHRWIERLASRGPAARRELVPLAPHRAEVLLGGAICLDVVLEALAAPGASVSVRGLRYGLLRDGGIPCPPAP